MGTNIVLKIRNKRLDSPAARRANHIGERHCPSLIDPEGDRSRRHVTLWRCDLALPLQLERSRCAPDWLLKTATTAVAFLGAVPWPLRPSRNASPSPWFRGRGFAHDRYRSSSIPGWPTALHRRGSSE